MAIARFGLLMVALLGGADACSFVVPVTLTSHTSDHHRYAGTNDNVTVSYEVNGSWTSPAYLCTGYETCDNDKTANISTSLASAPTKVKVHLLGDNGWLYDSLTLTVYGEKCSLATGDSWLDTDPGYVSVKTFDVPTTCRKVPVTLTSHTSDHHRYAGTNEAVTVSYEVDGSWTSPALLCTGYETCDNDKTATISTPLASVPTKVKVHLLGDNGWLYDSLTLTVYGESCSLATGDSWLDTEPGYVSTKIFDVRSASDFSAVTSTNLLMVSSSGVSMMALLTFVGAFSSVAAVACIVHKAVFRRSVQQAPLLLG